MAWKPTRAQRAMARRPTRKQIQAALDMQRPLDQERPEPVPRERKKKVESDEVPEF